MPNLSRLRLHFYIPFDGPFSFVSHVIPFRLDDPAALRIMRADPKKLVPIVLVSPRI